MIKSCTSLIWFYPNQILTRGDTLFNKHLDWSILTPFSLMHASKINYIDFVMTSDLFSVLEKFNVRHQWKCASSVAGFTACVVYRICNGLYHIVNVPAAWLTTSWAVCEPGAASRLFTAAVMTECTTQTAKKCVCVCLQCLFFFKSFFPSLHNFMQLVIVSLQWVCVCMDIAQKHTGPTKCFLFKCVLCVYLRWCAHGCSYNCVYTPVYVSGTILKVQIVWEGLERGGCHSLNAPPPSSSWTAAN